MPILWSNLDLQGGEMINIITSTYMEKLIIIYIKYCNKKNNNNASHKESEAMQPKTKDNQTVTEKKISSIKWKRRK